MCFVLSILLYGSDPTPFCNSVEKRLLLFTNSSLTWARDAATSRDLLPTLLGNVIPASKGGAKKGKSSHTPKLFDITISSSFAFLSSISLLGFLAQPLSSSCPNRVLFTYLIAVRIKSMVSQKSSDNLQNTKGSRVQVINFYARGSVTTK